MKKIEKEYKVIWYVQEESFKEFFESLSYQDKIIVLFDVLKYIEDQKEKGSII